MGGLRVGVVGVGNISGIYLQNLSKFEGAEVTVLADIDEEKASRIATEKGLTSASVDELIHSPDVDLVLNLTIPNSHYSVAKTALAAGKHVYGEKPLSVERREGAELLALAKDSNLRLGCAPDTFLGAGLQTCRQLIDDGAIGKPIGFNAFMMSRGPENWHPAPAFFYQRGGGPLFDMGPYYLTALVSLLGPIRQVAGMAKASFAERPISKGALAGTSLNVETPTHIIGALELVSGAIGQIQTTFDVWGATTPFIEIFGSEGTLSVPDPNNFGGPVKLMRAHCSEWEEIPLTKPYSENSRGVGIIDISNAILESRPHRASGDLAFHVLDCMHAILESAEAGKTIALTTQPAQPAPL